MFPLKIQRGGGKNLQPGVVGKVSFQETPALNMIKDIALPTDAFPLGRVPSQNPGTTRP